MTQEPGYPSVGTVAFDRKISNRQLKITEVSPGDRAGREVIGILREPGQPDRDYACDINIFWKVWE